MMETHVAVNRWHINMDTIKCVSVRVCYSNVRTSNTYKCVTSPGLYRCRQGPIWQNDMVKWCHKFATSTQFHVGCKNKTNETALEIVGENGKIQNNCFPVIHIRKIFLENLCEQCIVSINPNRTRFGLSVKYTPDEFWWCQWCRFVCIYICTHEADVYVCLSIRRLNGMHLNKSHVNQHLIPHTKRVCSLLTYVFVLEVVMRTHAHNLPQTISFLHLCA